ncbi:DNA glycosylase AlkZ-like family protein [Microlunatus speluncae]|uniref:DNA glycosylase AlkZ-like family protein n=1 Tax=Microlunatus speluncae TaxID=2594267 RepID=UPI0013757612|nr:crosslink repair DNA glycosylase YcaQ family protein [Microlunatus speluncae]
MHEPESFLRRQALGQRSRRTAEDLVEAVAGLNAQTAHGPIVGLWTRLARLSLPRLDEALRDYRLIKANLLRGTVHLVTRRQYLAWRPALQPMLERTVRGFCPGLWQQVDHDRLLAAGTELLRQRPGLTRAEIGDALSPSFPGPEPRRLGFAIRLLLPVVQLADESCWSPGRTRYLLADQAIGEPLGDAAAGTADLIRSFLRAFGPRTVADATYWSGLTRLGPVLTEVADRRSGAAYDVDPIIDQSPRPSVVLPEFDNVYFCSRDTSIGLIEAKARLVHGGAMPGSLITADAAVRGDWTATSRRLPELQPWSDLDDPERAEFDRFRAWWAAR